MNITFQATCSGCHSDCDVLLKKDHIKDDAWGQIAYIPVTYELSTCCGEYIDWIQEENKDG